MLKLLLSLVFSLNFHYILAENCDNDDDCDLDEVCVPICKDDEGDTCSCWRGECEDRTGEIGVVDCIAGEFFNEEGDGDDGVCSEVCGDGYAFDFDAATPECVDISSIGECPDEDEGGDDQGDDDEGDEEGDDDFPTNIQLNQPCGDEFGSCDGDTVCCAGIVIDRRRLLSDEQGEDDDEDDDEDGGSEDDPDTGICVATAGDCTGGGGQVFNPDNALVNNGEAETNAFGMKDATPAETGSIWAVIVIGAIIICSVSVWGIYQFVAKKKALTKLEGMQGTQQKSADSSEYGHDGSTATVSSQ